MANYTSVMINTPKNDDLKNKDGGIYPEAIVIINCVLNAPLMLISITGNSLALAAILRTSSLRTPSTVFLGSLAVSDLLVGLVVQPFFIATLFKSGGSLLQSYNMLSSSCCGVSLCTMTAISVDRFLALHYHMRYSNLMTSKRALHMALFIWFTFPLLSCIHFWGQNIFHFAIVVCIVVFILTSTFSYIRIYQIVCRHQLQIQAQKQHMESLNVEHNLHMAQSKETALNTFIYHICMILCYSPVFITSITQAALPKISPWAWTLTSTVAFMNSSINPFLYCWRISELRNAVLKTLRTVLFKQTEGN